MSATFAFAQGARTSQATSANNETSASAAARNVNLAANTALAAQLENSLDARHAKIGDRVVLKTMEAVRHNGETVVPKGARLLGHVTEVQQHTKENAESRIGVAFERLQKGDIDIPITATIVSITQAQTRSNVANSSVDSDMMSSSSGRVSSSGGQRRNDGSLLGGVGDTVGGVVNTTTSTVGSVAGTTTNAVGSTVGATTNGTGNLAGSLRGLQITHSSSASADAGSTLTLGTGNLKLESGTTFHLLVSSSTSAGTSQ
jgi:hypothetical protein